MRRNREFQEALPRFQRSRLCAVFFVCRTPVLLPRWSKGQADRGMKTPPRPRPPPELARATLYLPDHDAPGGRMARPKFFLEMS